MQLSSTGRVRRKTTTINGFLVLSFIVLTTVSCGSSDYSHFMDNCEEHKDFFTHKTCMSPDRLEMLCECLGNAIYNNERVKVAAAIPNVRENLEEADQRRFLQKRQVAKTSAYCASGNARWFVAAQLQQWMHDASSNKDLCT